MFKVGDRVRIAVTEQSRPMGLRAGDTGTIRYISDKFFEVGVEFDKHIFGHNLWGEISNGRGWFLFPSQLEATDE